MTQGGYGATLRLGEDLVAKIQDYEFPEFEKLVADVTTHDSPDGYAEYIATGKRQLNEFTVTLLWDAAIHEDIQAAFDSDEAVNFIASDPDGNEAISFSGHVTKIGRVAEQDDGLKAEITIQPSGPPTFSP